MNLHDQKATFEKQLQLVIEKSKELEIETRLIKSKLRKLDRIIKEAEELNMDQITEPEK